MASSDWCNEHRKTVGTVTVLCVVAAIGSIVWQVMGQRHAVMTKLPDRYFSADDGKTFFSASSDNIAPFDYQGHAAVRAYVYECHDGGQKFVGYLERYTPEARQAELDNKATAATDLYGKQYKKPGDKTWVNSGDFKAAASVADVKCPDGSDPISLEP
ncbi:MAG TPA: hypothetical protein VGG19_12730 [Tepidisphaeraceae bacterium]|jgi:gamma-glutamylcyclotransferase (GGCT)/AIG2-like uncharacterized protein YtfP